MSEEAIFYVWFDNPIWRGGNERKRGQILCESRHPHEVMTFAREQLLAGGGGLLRHFDVNGVLQGVERVVVPRPEDHSRKRLSLLAE